ncbi:MAG TPA: hypothetical protein VGY54_09750, partial [Polyangiaceae bacterium]|nr:hypothetical protein [Polyangiaceae bacterium]
MQRRSVLAALAAVSVLSAARSIRAQPTMRLKSIARDARGTTLFLALDHAPFAPGGGPYRDDTVLVFVPSHYRYRDE